MHCKVLLITLTSNHQLVHCGIGVAGSFSEGGQPFHPAKIQSFPAKIFSYQGGGQVLQICSAKLLCQATLLNCSANGQMWQINAEKHAKMEVETGKYGENQQKVALS